MVGGGYYVLSTVCPVANIGTFFSFARTRDVMKTIQKLDNRSTYIYTFMCNIVVQNVVFKIFFYKNMFLKMFFNILCMFFYF